MSASVCLNKEKHEYKNTTCQSMGLCKLKNKCEGWKNYSLI